MQLTDLQHVNCRCVYEPLTLAVEVEKALVEICMISSRRLDDVRNSFSAHLKKQPYGALDLAQICRNQARAGLPLPWEENYEKSILESIFL